MPFNENKKKTTYMSVEHNANKVYWIKMNEKIIGIYINYNFKDTNWHSKLNEKHAATILKQKKIYDMFVKCK